MILVKRSVTVVGVQDPIAAKLAGKKNIFNVGRESGRLEKLQPTEEHCVKKTEIHKV